MTTGIYMFTNKENGKKYIGQSVNIERRKEEHIKWPSKYSKFDNYLKVAGINAFDFVILEECKANQLDEREKYWIEFYNSIEEGYNLVPGGQNYRGQENIRAKLNDDQVYQIIILLEQGELNNSEIAKKFNVHHNTIDYINRCKTWTHLHDYKENIRQTNLNKRKRPHSSFTSGLNGSTKIDEKKALQIIESLSNANFKSLAQTSRDHNVSIDIVTDINRCRTWKYLHDYKKNIRDESAEQRRS